MKHLDNQIIAMYCYIEYLCALRDEANRVGDEATYEMIKQQIEVEEEQMSDLIAVEKALQPSLN
jgi:hypothetical protein